MANQLDEKTKAAIVAVTQEFYARGVERCACGDASYEKVDALRTRIAEISLTPEEARQIIFHMEEDGTLDKGGGETRNPLFPVWWTGVDKLRKIAEEAK